MAKVSKSEIRDKLDEGAIRILVTFQVVGKPKKHVEKSLDEYINIVRNEKALTVLDEHIEKAEELEDQDGFFSTIGEMELLVPSIDVLSQIAFNLTPASIEIIEPMDFSFDARKLQNWINDLLSMLHSIATNLRGERQKNSHLNNSVLRLANNFILILLASGSKDLASLKRMTGLDDEPLKRILEKMEGDDLIEKEGDSWIQKSLEK